MHEFWVGNLRAEAVGFVGLYHSSHNHGSVKNGMSPIVVFFHLGSFSASMIVEEGVYFNSIDI